MKLVTQYKTNVGNNLIKDYLYTVHKDYACTSCSITCTYKHYYRDNEACERWRCNIE